jgi:hypothetical protein
MFRTIHARFFLAAALTALAALPQVQVAHAGTPEPDVPTAIEVPAGNKVFLAGHAVGVQIYSCDPATGWVLVAPRANLYDDHGTLVATHHAGPSWQARDGSTVLGTVDRRAPVPGSIPWLRLAKASTTVGADGDRLTATKYIQRIATTGGLAPAPADCTDVTAGSRSEVPYTADYYFWKSTGS